MRTRYLLCTIMFTFTAAITTQAASYTAQTIQITAETVADTAIETTDAKIITDNFSFKIPEGWTGNCILIHDDTSLEIYNKSSYETDGTGLLFTIAAFDNSEYQKISDCSILGYGGNTTYVLIHDYICTFEDASSAEYQSCKDAEKILRKSFLTFITE